MSNTTISFERHPSLFKKGKLLATGDFPDVLDLGKGRTYNPRTTILEGTYKTDANYKPESSHRVYERERIKSGKPASHYHQTAIARDINNVRKRRS